MSNNKELISVVVPVYKVEEYLKRCIDSILNQTYKNFELILVDDGSPDKSPKICDEYSFNHLNISVIHQKNAGLSAARNAGIDIAKGKCITFIDSDDYVNEFFLETLKNNLDKYKVPLSMCSFVRFCETSEKKTKYNESEDNVKVLNEEDAMEMILDNQVKCTAWGKLYDISLFNGLRYPVGKLMEDMFITPLLFQRAKFIAVSNQKLYNYNQESTSIIRSKFNYRKIDMIHASIFWRKFTEEFYPNLIEKANIHYYTNLINMCYPLSQIKEEKGMMIFKQYRDILINNFFYILSSKFTTKNNKIKMIFLIIGLFKYFVKIKNILSPLRKVHVH